MQQIVHHPLATSRWDGMLQQTTRYPHIYTYLSCHLGLQHMREGVEKSMPWLVWWTSYGSMFDHFQTWRSGTNKPEVVKWLCQRVRELGTEQIPNFLASHRGARLWWRKFGRSMSKASGRSCVQRGAAKLLDKIRYRSHQFWSSTIVTLCLFLCQPRGLQEKVLSRTIWTSWCKNLAATRAYCTVICCACFWLEAHLRWCNIHPCIHP